MGAGLLKLRWELMVTPFTGITKGVIGALKTKAAGSGDAGVGEDLAAGIPAGPLVQPLPAGQVVESLRRLDAWLGLSRTTQREWRQRLPAVAAASLVLTAYAWGAGLKPVDPKIALGLAVAAAMLSHYTDSAEA